MARRDPLRNFRFRLEINGIQQAGFTIPGVDPDSGLVAGVQAGPGTGITPPRLALERIRPIRKPKGGKGVGDWSSRRVQRAIHRLPHGGAPPAGPRSCGFAKISDRANRSRQKPRRSERTFPNREISPSERSFMYSRCQSCGL